MVVDTWTEINESLIKSIKDNSGLNCFIKNRSKFEGWLKVEICNILSKNQNIDSLQVEKYIEDTKQHIDIYFEYKKSKYYIELKTLNTSYKIAGIVDKIKPITDNVNGVIKDIQKLKNINDDLAVKIVIFIVFPLDLSNENQFEENHLSKIIKAEKFKLFKETKIEFNNSKTGMLYLLEH